MSTFKERMYRSANNMLEKYDIDLIPPEEFAQIQKAFDYTSNSLNRVEMVQHHHLRDLTFINEIRNQYYDNQRKTPVLLSPKQRTWFEFIASRIERGYYNYPNIAFMVEPPKSYVEMFGDIYSNQFLDEEEKDDE